MSLTRILAAGLATTILSSAALANDDYYRCNDRLCYDDQAEETRRLNLEQLENQGRVEAGPRYDDDRGGQGGPYYEPPDQNDNYGPGPDDDDGGYGMSDDDDDDNSSAPDDDDQYQGDDD